MTPFIYIGVDPGTTGALAFYWAEQERLTVYDMPTRVRKNGRVETDANVLASHFERYTSRFRCIAAVEKVAAMTGRESSASSFQFGRSFGAILGVLAAQKITVLETPPAVWKAKLNLGRDKNESNERAKRLFPRHAKWFSRVKDHGRAEAALLAHWALISWGIENE